MNITHQFDSGSIDVIDINERENIQLKRVQDNNADTKKWFHFKLETQKDTLHKIRLINAGESSFSSAWHGYRVMASYDENDWFRVENNYDRKELVITHTPEQNVISYAYFVPYSYQNIIKDVCLSTQGKATIIARQHPGKTMAQWSIEGLIKRLITTDTMATELLERSVFYIVPNMNPDGSTLGNYITNNKGFNLNRQ
jgi:murein tripeptide amidase MpaA